jgi:perosamine synthetase
MYSILVENNFGTSRDDLIKILEEREIETRPFFYPIHVMPPYKNNEKFSVAEEISRKGINLPSGTTLKDENVLQIVKSIRRHV